MPDILLKVEEQILLETQNLQAGIYIWFEDRTVTPFCTKKNPLR
jgi:hypothetical protein